MTPSGGWPGWAGRHVRAGATAGALIVFLGLVGVIETFGKRSIVQGVVGLPEVLSLVIVFALARRAGEPGPHWRAGLAGVLAGLAAALVVAGFVAIGPTFVVGGTEVRVRDMFIRASPQLYAILASFMWRLPLAGLVAGLAGLVPPAWRRPLGAGLGTVILLGLLSDHVKLILDHNAVPAAWTRRLIDGKALTPAGAAAAGLAAGLLRGAWLARGGAARAMLAARPPEERAWLRRGALAACALGMLALPRVLGAYHSEVLNQVGLFVLMGLGLNIVVGFAGMLDLGYVAFFALGAYTMAVLTSPESFLATSPDVGFTGFWTALPICIVVAVVAGIMLGVPVLRLRGDYLAIVTLGFGEIIRLLAMSDWLKPYLGGAQGLKSIPAIQAPFVGLGETCARLGVDFPLCIYRVSIAGPDKPQKLFYIILAGCGIAAFVAARLKDSRLGRAWMALREDEDVAQAMGIDLVRTKLMAFAIGAAFSGLSGTIFAPKLVSIFPHSFGLLISINILALVIVGGMGSIAGVVVGALALVGLPELLREFAEYRLWVYGMVLVGMMLYRPEGLLPSTVTRRERQADAPNGGGPAAEPAGGGAVA